MRKGFIINCSSMARIMCLFVLLMFQVGGVCIVASEELSPRVVTLQVRQIDPTIVHDPMGRLPLKSPTITIDDHTLCTAMIKFDVTLRLLDDNDEVVYMTFVPMCTPSVTFPSDLSGNYQIQLIYGNWCFYGWIDL